MRVLGLSAFYHDSAAALVEDGRVVAAAQEERFTRQKFDANFPKLSLEYCLAEAGCSLGDVDYVVFYDKPFIKFERLLETYLTLSPRGFTSFRMALPLWLREKLFQKSLIASELKNLEPKFDWQTRLLFCEHHLSHAASAFYPSPFERAAVLTLDGVGEWTTTAVAVGEGPLAHLLLDARFGEQGVDSRPGVVAHPAGAGGQPVRHAQQERVTGERCIVAQRVDVPEHRPRVDMPGEVDAERETGVGVETSDHDLYARHHVGSGSPDRRPPHRAGAQAATLAGRGQPAKRLRPSARRRRCGDKPLRPRPIGKQREAGHWAKAAATADKTRTTVAEVAARVAFGYRFAAHRRAETAKLGRGLANGADQEGWPRGLAKGAGQGR